MDRRELIRLLVLNEIGDDFENVDQIILPHVAKGAAKCGLAVERSEIVDALAGLVKDGLAKAYNLTPPVRDPFSRELQGMPSLDVVEEYFTTYFYVTKQGMDLQLSDDTAWLFDEEGNPRPDWHLGGQHS
jgi:hypothetical protein